MTKGMVKITNILLQCMLNVIHTLGVRCWMTHTLFEALPQAARVVIELVEPYLDQGQHVFTDRYYTSIPLAQALHNCATSFTGTANKTRADLPNQIRGRYLHDGRGDGFPHRPSTWPDLARTKEKEASHNAVNLQLCKDCDDTILPCKC